MDTENVDHGSWSGGALSLAESVAVAAPNLVPQLATEVWCRPTVVTAKWQRRYAVQAANFLYLFARREDAPHGRAEAVICFENMHYAPRDIGDDEIARCADLFAISDFGFELRPGAPPPPPPPPLSFRRGGPRAVGYLFCAETAPERRCWATAFKRWRCCGLAEDNQNLRTELECKELELRELKRVLAEALSKAEDGADGSAVGSGGAASADHAKGSPAGGNGNGGSPQRRGPTEQELSDASIKLQALTRGKLSRQKTGTIQVTPPDSRAGRARRSTRTFMSGVGKAIGSAVSAVLDAGNSNGGGGGGGGGGGHAGSPGSAGASAASAASAGATEDDGDDDDDAASFDAHLSKAAGPDAAHSAAQEAAGALRERGEKLQTLANVADNLSAESETFAANAARIRRQAEKEARLPF